MLVELVAPDGADVLRGRDSSGANYRLMSRSSWPPLATLKLGGDCDRKAKPFGRGRGIERLACAVSMMLLVARSAKRRRKGVRSIEDAIRIGEASECPSRDWRMAQSR